MPQIAQLALVYQSQWLWLALVLAAIYFGIGKGMLPRIEATVDLRDSKIADDLAAAQRARVAADQTEEEWRGEMAAEHAAAQRVAAQAKIDATKEAAGRVAEADAVLADRMAASGAALAEARKAAMVAIESVAADAARDIVAKVSGVAVTPAEANKAVKMVFANG